MRKPTYVDRFRRVRNITSADIYVNGQLAGTMEKADGSVWKTDFRLDSPVPEYVRRYLRTIHLDAQNARRMVRETLLRTCVLDEEA